MTPLTARVRAAREFLTGSMSAEPRKHLWILGLFALLMIGLMLTLWSAQARDAIMAFKRNAGPLPFFAAMAVLPAFAVPITPFFVVSGAVFGVSGGVAGSLVALAVNLALCHWIARSVLRQQLRQLMRRFDYQLPDFEQGASHAFRFTLMVKVTPGLPAFAKNYLLGLVRVPFGVYMAGSMLVTGPYAAGLVVLGESLLEHEIGRGSMALAALLMAAGLIGWWWRRARRDPG